MSDDATLDEFVSGDSTAEEKTESRGEVNDHPRFGKLPNEWDIVEIGDIAEVVGGSTPSTNNSDYWGGGIPWATPTDITDLDGNTIEETADTLTEEGLESASTHLLPSYSVLMTSRATIGECAVNTVEMCTNQGFKSLVPEGDLETWYLHYRMLQTTPFLESLGAGSTFDEVSKSVVKSVEIPVPPLSEQRKIATVLHTVDQAIQKTGEIIERTKRLEQGLMQDLFRKGVKQSETKELRRIGEVPRHWEVVSLGDVCSEITDGTHKSPPTIDDGYPYVTSQNVRDWGFDLDDLKYISEEDHERITSRCNPEPNDVLYVKDGANTGNVNVNTLDFEFSLLSSVALIKPDRNRLKPWFLKYLLSWSKFRQLVLSQMSGTGISRLTISKLEKTDILLPPIEEQERIVEILDTYYQHHSNQKHYRDQLKYLKQGLMQDLLSGEVRTTDIEIDIPEKVAKYG